jgi:hypothetical protein
MTTPHALVIQSHAARPRWRQLSVLLLDVSASMEAGRPRRIELLWEAVRRLRTPESRWRVTAFSSDCRWINLQTCPEPYGSTDVAGAFGEIGRVNPTAVTLITDGQPDDADAAQAAGLLLKCPIHICFVGDADDLQAVEFCQHLCEATKGTFATEALTLAALEKTTHTIRRMLGDGTSKTASMPLGGPRRDADLWQV